MSKVVAYVGTWSRYRASPHNFLVEDIDPTLCTHLIYAFAGLDESTSQIKCMDQWQDIDDGIGGYKKATKLRARNPRLKVLIAIGGWNEGSDKYSKMAASANKRKLFVKSVVEFISKYEFDGLDLDWEYPGVQDRGGCPADKETFVLLIKDLRQEFDRPGRGWLLTAALGASKQTINAAYNIKAISAHLDFMNIMTYDYHGDWDKKAGANTPLHAQDDGLSMEDTLKYLISQGAPKQKIVLGLAMYGKTFCLTSSSQRGLGAPSSTGFKGQYTNQPGMVAYYEICALKKEGWNEYWDDKTSTPYLMNDTKLVSFDNLKSIRLKMEYGKSMGIGGFMAWSIDMDDFRGISGETFPLLRLMKR